MVKVVANNYYGDSETSETGGSAKIWLLPEAPIALTNDTVTNKDLVGITWSDGLNQGGTPVIDYRVMWDKSYGTYEILAEGVLPKQFSTTGLTLISGRTYSFKV